MIASYVSSYSGGRSENEDCADFFHKDRNWCCVLADGLGGMRYGAEAAALVVKAVKESFYSDFLRAGTLEQTVLRAHEALCAYKRENRIGRGCYSTIALLYGTQEQIWWTHCGDSRVYLFRHGVLERRTKDHSVPQMLALCGEINSAEIRYHPDRNRLLSCLGVDDQLPQIAKVDSTTLEPGLALLLCSDGFWEPVTEQQMERSLAQARDVRAWVAQMNNIVAQLPQKETLDNYTAVGVWIS